MEMKVLKTFIGISMVYFLALIAAFLPTASFADDNQNLTIQTVELHPGDVINFRNGPATFMDYNDTWGHSAMYLGIVDGEKKFLDFTTNKNKSLYKGRILNEKDFLFDNSHGFLKHEEFDVFRLSDTNTKVNQDILVKKAQDIARDTKWTPRTNCSRVVAEVLSAATDTEIKVRTPSGFAEGVEGGFGFYQLANGRVNIATALNERQGVQISGEWRGAYSYDDSERAGEEVNFTMTVNQQGSAISGRIRDNEIGGATFSGNFDANTMQINFTKTYGGDKPQVAYSGSVSGNTAAGRWHIGDYAGSWEMHR